MRNCKKFRLLAGMTQAEVAKRINRSTISVCMYETGRHMLPVGVAKRMATLYGCEWHELYEEDSNNG